MSTPDARAIPVRSVQLTPLELTFIAPELGDEVVLRRLCILLSLKAAYIKAVGQSRGFDWSRLEFNIPNESARGDDHPLQGWVFGVSKPQLGVQGSESYQRARAFSWGTKESKFIWHDNAKNLETWVQFINIDDMSWETMRINYKISSVCIFCARKRGEMLPNRR